MVWMESFHFHYIYTMFNLVTLRSFTLPYIQMSHENTDLIFVIKL